MKTLLIYALSWLGLVILAIANGALREKVFVRFLRELPAHQLSTVTGIIIFGIYIWFLTGAAPLASPGPALIIGGLWLVMTVAFEFGFGHYGMGHPWSKLLHDYNVLQGRLWPLVLIWIAAAPYVCYRLRASGGF